MPRSSSPSVPAGSATHPLARALSEQTAALAATASDAAGVGALFAALSQSSEDTLAHLVRHVPASALSMDLRALVLTTLRWGIGVAPKHAPAVLYELYGRPDLSEAVVSAALDDCLVQIARGREHYVLELRVMIGLGRLGRAHVSRLFAGWEVARANRSEPRAGTLLSTAMAALDELTAEEIATLAGPATGREPAQVAAFLAHPACTRAVWEHLRAQAHQSNGAAVFWRAWMSEVPPTHPEAAWGAHLIEDLRDRLLPYDALVLLNTGRGWGAERWRPPVLHALLERLGQDAAIRQRLYHEMPAVVAALVPPALMASYLAEADREGRLHLVACLAQGRGAPTPEAVVTPELSPAASHELVPGGGPDLDAPPPPDRSAAGSPPLRSGPVVARRSPRP